MVSNTELIAGILTLLPLVIGYTMAIISFRIYRKGGSNLVLLTSILFFALPSPWLGVSTVFIEQLLGLNVLNPTAYVFLYAWSVPIIALVWNYTSASLIKYKDYIKYIVLAIIGILDLIFLWAIYIDKQFEVNEVQGSIFLDSTFTGTASLVSTLVVASVILFVAPLYFWIAYKTEDPLFKFKARFIGLGALLFSFSAGLDASIELGSIGLVIVVRLALVTSLILLYLGYNTPDRIKSRYQT